MSRLIINMDDSKKFYILRSNITDYQIVFCTEGERGELNEGDCTPFGPFKNFTQAKAKALYLVRDDIRELQVQAQGILETRKKDFS